MKPAPALHLDTPMAAALRSLLEALRDRLRLGQPLEVIVCGGMAVHLYTGSRVTTDVDAEFGARIALPGDLAVAVAGEGASTMLYFDTNFNTTFALMHEDYRDDAIEVPMAIEGIALRVLGPTDLAVSKIARFAEVDRADIVALASLGLTDASAIERRASEALGGFVGELGRLRANIRDAATLARSVQPR